jgi:hypothetical protein
VKEEDEKERIYKKKGEGEDLQDEEKRERK